VVNVYRLITRGTLEEKVMGLQKFKLNIANTVVTTDNSSLKTMDTGQLLDLFAIEVREEARRPVARHTIPSFAMY
jgi:TATA-binding protein-associated factor